MTGFPTAQDLAVGMGSVPARTECSRVLTQHRGRIEAPPAPTPPVLVRRRPPARARESRLAAATGRLQADDESAETSMERSPPLDLAARRRRDPSSGQKYGRAHRGRQAPARHRDLPDPALHRHAARVGRFPPPAPPRRRLGLARRLHQGRQDPRHPAALGHHHEVPADLRRGRAHAGGRHRHTPALLVPVARPTRPAPGDAHPAQEHLAALQDLRPPYRRARAQAARPAARRRDGGARATHDLEPILPIGRACSSRSLGRLS